MCNKVQTFTLTISLFLSLMTNLVHAEDNAKQAQWISLFNGKNLEGWTAKFNNHAAGDNHLNTFRVENGLLTVAYDKWSSFPKNAFGHLITNKSYKHYRLRVQYRFIGEQVTNSPEYNWAYRNNGIMLHSQSAHSMEIDQAFPISGESQLLGGNGKEARSTGNFCSPSTNIIKDGKLVTSHCLTSNANTYHGDQWVWFELEVNGDGSVKHIIDNKIVFEYQQLQIDPTDKYGKKWLASGKPLNLVEGHIALQAETHPTQFKVIEIMPLD